MLFRSSLTHTLFDCPPCLPKEDECYIDKCDDPTNSFQISLFDEIVACDTCAHDTTMNETCENDFATVIFPSPKWKTPEGFSQKRYRAPPPPETLVRGTEVPDLAPCQDGDSEEIVAILTNVSPSTNHVSPIHV